MCITGGNIHEYNTWENNLIIFIENLKSKRETEIVKLPLFQLSQYDHSYGKMDFHACLGWEVEKGEKMHL